jgi:hypothetical protein
MIQNDTELGTNSSKTGATTIAITLAQDVLAGSLVEIRVVYDNSLSATIPYGTQLSASDASANPYHKLLEYNHGAGTAGAGTLLGHFMSVLANDLQSGDAITITGPSVAVRAITVRVYTIDSEQFYVYDRLTDDADGIDPPSLTVDGDPDFPTLFSFALASEGPSTDTYTPDGDFTAVTTAGTTGGTADSNQAILGGYEIDLATTETADWSSSANRTLAESLCAITEFIADPYTGKLYEIGDPKFFARLDDPEWGTLMDITPNYHYLDAFSGSPTFRGSGPPGQTYAMDFDTGGDFAEAATAASTVTNNFWMRVWVYLHSVGANNQRLFYNGNSGANGWGILIDTNRTFQFLAGGVALGANSAGALSLSTWHCIDIVRDAGTWVYYLDGLLDTANAGTNTPNAPSGVTRLGDASVAWKAARAHIAEYVPTAAQIKALYDVAQQTVAPVPEALETDIAYPLGTAATVTGAEGTAVDTIAVPSSPGTLAVTGLGFEPTWLFVVATNAASEDSWQLGDSCMSKGIAGIDFNTGDIFQAMNRIVLDETAQGASGYDADVLIEVADERGAIGEHIVFRAELISFDSDGFTLDFTHAASGYVFHYLAGEHAASAQDISFSAAVELFWDSFPNAAIYVGLSDVAAPITPSSWNGAVWTAQTGAGRIQPADDPQQSEFIWWCPGYNFAQKYNQIEGPLLDWAGVFQDPWFFGSVLQSPIYIYRDENNVTILSSGNWVAALLILADTDAAAASGDAADTVGEVADIGWSDPSFRPSALLHIQGNTKGLLSQDAAHAGASIGASSGGKYWAVALGSNMGVGAAVYRTELYSWISAWDPFDDPDTMSAGISTGVANAARLTTLVADHSDFHVKVCAIGRRRRRHLLPIQHVGD